MSNISVSLSIQPTGDAEEDKRLSQIKAYLETRATPREAILAIEQARVHIRRNIRNAFATAIVLNVLAEWEALYARAIRARRAA